MKELHGLNKLSEKSQINAVIMLGGCGTIGRPHQNIISFLENQNLEVYQLNRFGDKTLGEKEGAIEQYLEDIRDIVLLLVNEGKKVHLWTNSFGSFLGLKVCEEVNSIISIVAIAPILDPIKALSKCINSKDKDGILINLPDGRKIPILNKNLEYLENKQIKLILPSGLIILGSNDGLTDTSELKNVNGENLIKYIIEGAQHGNSTSNEKTIEITRNFYSNIISN